MIRTSVLTFALALAALAIPPQAMAKPFGGGTGSIAGVAQSQSGQMMAGTHVRVRDLGNQQVVGSTTVNNDGRFSVAGLAQGAYLVEVVNAQGNVIGAGNVASLSSGNMNDNVTVTTNDGEISANRISQSFTAAPGSRVALVNIAGNVVAMTVPRGEGNGGLGNGHGFGFDHSRGNGFGRGHGRGHHGHGNHGHGHGHGQGQASPCR